MAPMPHVDAPSPTTRIVFVGAFVSALSATAFLLIGNMFSSTDEDGNIATTTKKSFMFGTLSVDDEPIPSAFNLEGNYPNPFNPTTKINFSVQSPSDMDLSVYAWMESLCVKFL